MAQVSSTSTYSTSTTLDRTPVSSKMFRCITVRDGETKKNLTMHYTVLEKFVNLVYPMPRVVACRPMYRLQGWEISA